MDWPWHPHPDVWALIAVLAGGYLWLLRRVGPTRVARGARPASGRQVATYAAGVVALWVAADWPLHDLGERYLYSAHMVQHLVLTLVAPPLLLLGTPAWLVRHLVSSPRLYRLLSRLTRPLVALIMFNAVVVVTHWPALVDLTLRVEVVHFAVHAALFGAALIMWCPVVSPLPEWRLASPPTQMLYLFLHSIVPTVPASFLVFAQGAIYRFYETVPRLWGISVTEDQRIGGLLMKLGGGLLLWGAITVIFFRWHADEEHAERQAGRWRALERELDSKWSPP